MFTAVQRNWGPVTSSTLLWSVLLGACSALGLALWAQHGWGMEPCAWCVLQRLLMMALACWALLGLLVRPVLGRWGGVLWGCVIAGVAVLGVLAAWYQHAVAAQRLSCAFTWADRTLMLWGLGDRWPALFEPRASCAEAAAAQVLGLPFAFWSGLGFALVALLGLALARQAWRRLP